MLLHCTVCTRFFFFYLFQEREVDFLAKEFELAKERQAEFLGDRYITLHFFTKKLSRLLLIKKKN